MAARRSWGSALVSAPTLIEDIELLAAYLERLGHLVPGFLEGVAPRLRDRADLLREYMTASELLASGTTVSAPFAANDLVLLERINGGHMPLAKVRS